MAEYPEAELLIDFRQGNPKAFKYVYDTFFNGLVVFAAAIVGNRTEGEDIVSETFFTLFKKNSIFQTISHIRGFLYLTVRNACINHLRYLRRLESQKREWAINMETEAGLEISQIEGELLNAIHKAMETLPRRSGLILQMYLKGWDTAQIAGSLNISTLTVRSQKRYAINLLRTALSNKKIMVLAMLLIFFFV